jgi:hypothetical protein
MTIGTTPTAISARAGLSELARVPRLADPR